MYPGRRLGSPLAWPPAQARPFAFLVDQSVDTVSILGPSCPLLSYKYFPRHLGASIALLVGSSIRLSKPLRAIAVKLRNHSSPPVTSLINRMPSCLHRGDAFALK